MKFKIIIYIIVFIFVVLVYTIVNHKEFKTLVCNGDFALADGISSQEYTFEGDSNYIKKQKIEVIIHTTNKSIIDDYLSILRDNEECHDIVVKEELISYICDYDLVINHFYSSIEDDNGRLSFKVVKSRFEEDSFVCYYK